MCVNKSFKGQKIIDYHTTKKVLSKTIFIIGMIINLVGIIIPLTLKDYYTATAVSIESIFSLIAFILTFPKGKYSLFMGIMATLLSCLLFPSIMLTTDFPQQAILYQYIVPVIWTLALSDTENKAIYPIITGLFLAVVDGYKIYSILGLEQGIQYLFIFYAIYLFLFFITRVYIKSSYYAFKRLKAAVKTDYLTTAYNRFGITARVDDLISENIPFYLIYIDLDNFKSVNDTLGHKSGDDVLVKLVNFWRDKLSNVNGTIGRLGGDEFAIIVETNSKQFIEEILSRIIKEINSLTDDSLNGVTLSAGVVSYPTDSDAAQKLFMYADTALYKAKTLGKANYQFFNKETFKETVNEYKIKSRTASAIKTEDLYLVYQPQIDLKTNNVYGFEALLRLKDNNTGVSIQRLVQIAEKSSLIYDIDLYVLDLATKDCQEIIKKNKDLVISVNVSGKHLVYGNLANDIKHILDRNNFPAKNLCVEITEGAFIKSLNLAKSTIQQLNDLGVKIALDDFGMGYSSLAYLSELKVDHIKIEKFFIDNLLNGNNEGRLADIIINIGHLFNYRVIAEGVENQDQLKYLGIKNCDIIQGYLYSKPLTIDEVKEKLN